MISLESVALKLVKNGFHEIGNICDDRLLQVQYFWTIQKVTASSQKRSPFNKGYFDSIFVPKFSGLVLSDWLIKSDRLILIDCTSFLKFSAVTSQCFQIMFNNVFM